MMYTSSSMSLEPGISWYNHDHVVQKSTSWSWLYQEINDFWLPNLSWTLFVLWIYIDGLVLNCNNHDNSSAIIMELLQFCAKLSISATCMNMIHGNYHRLSKQRSHHGGCWWPDSTLAPGHPQPPWWCRPVCKSSMCSKEPGSLIVQ